MRIYYFLFSILIVCAAARIVYRNRVVYFNHDHSESHSESFYQDTQVYVSMNNTPFVFFLKVSSNDDDRFNFYSETIQRNCNVTLVVNDENVTNYINDNYDDRHGNHAVNFQFLNATTMLGYSNITLKNITKMMMFGYNVLSMNYQFDYINDIFSAECYLPYFLDHPSNLENDPIYQCLANEFDNLSVSAASRNLNIVFSMWVMYVLLHYCFLVTSLVDVLFGSFFAVSVICFLTLYA